MNNEKVGRKITKVDHVVSTNVSGSQTRRILLTVLGSLVGAVIAIRATGADQIVIRFRESPHIEHYVVRLGDVIEFVDGQVANVKQLLAAPLGPAPRPGKPQTWHADAILRHLELRGIARSKIRWSGPTETSITFSAPQQAAHMVPAFVSDRAVKQAESVVAQAIRDYINRQASHPTHWRISPHVPDALVPVLQTKRNLIAIGGGEPPWEGKHTFTVKVRDSNTEKTVNIQADIEMPPLIVAANRPMRRGEVITEDDLQIVPLTESHGSDVADYFTDVQQVIGKELRRSVSMGLPIRADYIGDPVLIERNSLVQVESVSGPIVVSTQGRALRSGSKGELIEVEIIATREHLYGIVIDPVTVRIATQGKLVR